MSSPIAIDFSANVITSLGEQVFICGNITELGAWNPNNALKLFTNKDLYPEWKNKKPLVIPPNISLQFKICVKSNHGIIRWQKIQQNRKFVPIESVLISFTQQKTQMSFQSTIVQEEETKIRKNTFDIIRDLSDEISESSSGNERQFWMERRARDRATMSSSKQFVSDAKLIFDTWSTNRARNSYKITNTWTQILTTIHYVIKKQIDDAQRDTNLQSETLIPETAKHSTVVIENFRVDKNGQRIELKRHPDDVLKIFHIEDEEDNYHGQDWAKNVLKSIRKSEQGFFVIYLKNQRKQIDEFLLDRAQMIVAKNKQILRDCLQKFHLRKNHSVNMIKENEFLIKKQNNQSVIVLYEPSLPAFSQQFAKNQEYFSGVQKNLTNQKHFKLPQNMKLSIMIEKNFVRDVHKHKFCLVLLCQKLQEIPEKVITKLIRVSSCPNVSINIMTGDEIPEIFKKLPVSENDKLLVYNRGGEVFKPSKKPANIYESIHINYKKYEEVFKHLRSRADFWVKNRQVQVIQNHYSLQFICEKTALGEVISESLANQFSTYDQHRKYPYQIQKYVSEDKKKIVVHVRPLLSSTQFYSAIVTSINVCPPETTYFLSFDYTRDKYKFGEKMQRASNEKKAIHEAFVMEDQQGGVGGLATRKFDQFLSLLLNQAYYSIIESDLEESKSAIKKDRDIIRSDFIN